MVKIHCPICRQELYDYKENEQFYSFDCVCGSSFELEFNSVGKQSDETKEYFGDKTDIDEPYASYSYLCDEDRQSPIEYEKIVPKSTDQITDEFALGNRSFDTMYLDSGTYKIICNDSTELTIKVKD